MPDEKTKIFDAMITKIRTDLERQLEEDRAENEKLRRKIEAMKPPKRLLQTHDVRPFTPTERRAGRGGTVSAFDDELSGGRGPHAKHGLNVPDPEEREEAAIIANVKKKREVKNEG